MRTKAMLSMASLCVGLLHGGFAVAQSAPGGTSPATAPGGMEGTAGIANEREAIQSGEEIVIPGAPAGAVDPRATEGIPPVETGQPIAR